MSLPSSRNPYLGLVAPLLPWTVRQGWPWSSGGTAGPIWLGVGSRWMDQRLERARLRRAPYSKRAVQK